MAEFVTGLGIRFTDLIDLFLVWVVCYRSLLLVRRTGTVQMVSGLGILAILFILSTWLELATIHWLLEQFFNHLLLIIVVLFQVEIRRALAQIGSGSFLGTDVVQDTRVIEEILGGLFALSKRGYGALVVVEREMALDYFVEDGVVLDAEVTRELLISIFSTPSPLHDGAVVIKGSRLYQAGSLLPLSKNPELERSLGTRHRAAVGLTEETDALVLVMSEESHTLSLAQGGKINLAIDPGQARHALLECYGLAVTGDER